MVEAVADLSPQQRLLGVPAKNMHNFQISISLISKQRGTMPRIER